jgi:hypothetical protein
MTTQCNQTSFAFQPLASRAVVAQFNGGPSRSTLIQQCVFGMCLGLEEVNDHDQLLRDRCEGFVSREVLCTRRDGEWKFPTTSRNR